MFIMDDEDLEFGSAIYVDGKFYIYNRYNMLIQVWGEDEYKKLRKVFVG